MSRGWSCLVVSFDGDEHIYKLISCRTSDHLLTCSLACYSEVHQQLQKLQIFQLGRSLACQTRWSMSRPSGLSFCPFPLLTSLKHIATLASGLDSTTTMGRRSMSTTICKETVFWHWEEIQFSFLCNGISNPLEEDSALSCHTPCSRQD